MKIYLFIQLCITLDSSILFQDNNNSIFFGQYKVESQTIRQNFLSLIRDQNQPLLCDSSWAFAATNALAIQYNLLLNNQFPQVVLSPQMVMNCHDKDLTCEKNEIKMEEVLEQLKATGVSEEGCNNYYANTDNDCSNMNKCKDCSNGEDIHKDSVCRPTKFLKYKVKEFGKIEKDKEIKIQTDLKEKILEQLKKGPLVCSFKHSKKIYDFKAKNFLHIYEDESHDITSWVNVVGYIQKDEKVKMKTDILLMQMSIGENVGYYGIVAIPFVDEDPFGIKENCYWVTADEKLEVDQNDEKEDYLLKKVKKIQKNRLNQGYVPSFISQGEEIVLTLNKNEEEYKPVDWRNVDGVNYLTYTKNQHIPTYCGSCWAQAATSALQDRQFIKQMQDEKSPISFPRYTLSVQAIINCDLGGTCFGGDTTIVFQKGKNWTIPLETCQTYKSHNPEELSCSKEQVCSTNTPDGVKIYEKYEGIRVKSWGRVRGPALMKEALVKGPIACAFEVTDDFLKYGPREDEKEVNVYSKRKDYNLLNHAISVVGWNKLEDNTEYWIVRNSWGRHWGYKGFFYIKINENVLGIESDCSFGNPEFKTIE